MAKAPDCLQEFERAVWEAYNAENPSHDVPPHLDRHIDLAWSRLTLDGQERLEASYMNCIQRRSDLTMAENFLARASAYKGSTHDNDTYGREEFRDEFDEYEACTHELLAALHSFHKSIEQLQQDRRVLGFPSGDGVERHLDNMLCVNEEDILKFNFEIQSMPQRRQAASEKLAARKEASERKRIAEGRLGPLWEGKWPLGSGSFGTASLFVKQGSGGQIVDYVVIKDSSYQNRPAEWAAKELWTGWKGPDNLSSIPNEIEAMYKLSGKVGSETVVEIRNWRIRRADRFHRIYMEFCHQGDLYDLVVGSDTEQSPYVRGGIMRRMFGTVDAGDRVDLVPEAFLWSTFLSLTIAGLLMERGTLKQRDINSGPWSVIVHRDLKLSNVLMGWNNVDRFRGYPSIKGK